MHGCAILGTAFNGTLTISTKYESGNGYDMGANHTYRYIKTSGLGIAPKYWTSDIITSTATRNTRASAYAITGTMYFRIHSISSTNYCMMTCLKANGNTAYPWMDWQPDYNNKNFGYDVTFNAGIFGSESLTLSNCLAPTVRQATYNIGNDLYLYGESFQILCDINNNDAVEIYNYRNDTVEKSSVVYWTRSYYNDSSTFIYCRPNGSNDKFITVKSGSYGSAYVFPYVEVPIS